MSICAKKNIFLIILRIQKYYRLNGIELRLKNHSGLQGYFLRYIKALSIIRFVIIAVCTTERSEQHQQNSYSNQSEYYVF